jgi:predicted nucleic acid-binding protein
LTDIVLDASAGVELALRTPVGRQLRRRLPEGAATWVPEHYYAEATAVLRRDEISGRLPAVRVQAAFDRLLAVPAHRFAVKPLMREAWQLRHNLTIADALYVVVAQHLGAELVTTDLRLANAPGLPVATITP